MYPITLVLIARNEAASIRRCLDSVRPWVNHLLVLDTGSSDDTVRLAQESGARVEHFPWIDDFAAARNHALNLAKSDWNLVLDADEWVKEGGPELATLRQVRPDFIGSIRIDSDFSALGSDACTSSWISRVLPRGVRYAGRIHEQPAHDMGVRRLAVHIGHSGYSPQAMVAKQGRNAALLERVVDRHQSNACDQRQLRYAHGRSRDRSAR